MHLLLLVWINSIAIGFCLSNNDGLLKEQARNLSNDEISGALHILRSELDTRNLVNETSPLRSAAYGNSNGNAGGGSGKGTGTPTSPSKGKDSSSATYSPVPSAAAALFTPICHPGSTTRPVQYNTNVTPCRRSQGPSSSSAAATSAKGSTSTSTTSVMGQHHPNQANSAGYAHYYPQQQQQQQQHRSQATSSPSVQTAIVGPPPRKCPSSESLALQGKRSNTPNSSSQATPTVRKANTPPIRSSASRESRSAFPSSSAASLTKKDKRSCSLTEPLDDLLVNSYPGPIKQQSQPVPPIVLRHSADMVAPASAPAPARPSSRNTNNSRKSPSSRPSSRGGGVSSRPSSRGTPRPDSRPGSGTIRHGAAMDANSYFNSARKRHEKANECNSVQGERRGRTDISRSDGTFRARNVRSKTPTSTNEVPSANSSRARNRYRNRQEDHDAMTYGTKHNHVKRTKRNTSQPYLCDTPVGRQHHDNSISPRGPYRVVPLQVAFGMSRRGSRSDVDSTNSSTSRFRSLSPSLVISPRSAFDERSDSLSDDEGISVFSD